MRFISDKEEDIKETSLGVNSTNSELEVNKKNREDFENLMKNSSTKTDDYWDSNDIFVKLVLLGLGLIIVVGVVYYIVKYMGIN